MKWIFVKKKFIRSAKLSELLHCSTSSIRRALIQLENKNLIVRMHGGVSLVQDSNVEFAYTYREETNITKKREIVQIAQEFMEYKPYIIDQQPRIIGSTAAELVYKLAFMGGAPRSCKLKERILRSDEYAADQKKI